MSYSEPGLAVLSLAIFTSTLGLFMLNYPQGRIFMGDAGAYTLGFLLAACLITLHHRHPEILPWAILLVIFWPIADMAHSIVRRRLGGKKPDRPDMVHMHHVVMRTLTAYSGGRITRQIANPLATALILPLASVPVICGYVFRENNTLCVSLTLIFLLVSSLCMRPLSGYQCAVRTLVNYSRSNWANLSPCLYTCNRALQYLRQKLCPSR